MWFLLILILGMGALAFWMWKRPDPVKRDQAKAVGHDLWIDQLDAQLKFAERLMLDAPTDYARAYELYQNLAKQNEIPQAYVAMGQMHLQGLGREVSVENALALLEKANSLGSDDAAYVLGQVEEGIYGGVPNIEKAQYWYRHAISRGHLDAQYRLAELNPEDQTHAEQQHLDLLQKNADDGHANSQYQLAQCYLNQATPNIALGLEYLLKAAQQDHMAAIQQLQQFYAQGKYLAQNDEKSLQYLKRGLLLGHQQQLYEYYQAVLMGKIDVDQRQRVYHDLLQQAKEHKVAAASRLLGIAHFHGWYLEKQETLGFRFLTEAAQLKDADAISLIAALYFEKYLVSDDPQKAFELYQTAYQFKPLFINQVGLALCYLHGVGVERNIKQAQQLLVEAARHLNDMSITCVADQNYVIGRFYALREYPLAHRDQCLSYLEKAAEQGSQDAAWYLYRLAVDNILPDLQFDDAQTQRALLKAAKLGHSDALTQLGVVNLKGQWGTQDFQQALQYFSQAAGLGNVTALYQLGEMSEHGLGVQQDLTQAHSYYAQAAQGMSAAALTRLGYLYIHGMGVERDLKIAQQYLEKAALQGYVEAQEQLENIHAFLNTN